MFCVLVSQVMRKLQRKLPLRPEGFSIKDGHGGRHSDGSLGPADTSQRAANGTAASRTLAERRD